MSHYNGLSFPVTTFQFYGIKLKEACWIDGAPYFSRKTIGEWLNYKFPEESIAKIIDRNPHIKQFQVLVNLTRTWGKNSIKKKVKVYDPIGLQLIINKSNQPKAVAFQISVAKLVVSFIKGELVQKETAATENSKDPRQIAVNRFKQIEKLAYGEKTNEMQQLADELGVASQTLYGWKTQYKKYGKIEDKRKTQGARKKIKTLHLQRWKSISNLLDANYSIKEIKEILHVSDSQIYRVKSRYKKRWFDKIV